MPDFWSYDIAGDNAMPPIHIRQFENGSVQIHQLNKYQHRGGKTIYLSRQMFLQLRNHLIEEMGG